MHQGVPPAGGSGLERETGGSQGLAKEGSNGAIVSNQMRTKKQTRDRCRSAAAELKRILKANQRGEHTGIYSVCSANQAVLEAAMAQALRDDGLL